MIDNSEFRKYAHQLADWMADYYLNIDKLPVKSQVDPGDIIKSIPVHPPETGESIDSILQDFNNDIIPGMTHWQSPNYFAYFPANGSYPSLLAEMLTATLAAQCMIWDTSPAAAELEEQMMNWLKEMTGLPSEWSGVIQDGASTATLTSLLTAREVKTSYGVNDNGLYKQVQFRVYCSSEAHSSIEKAVKISGLGKSNLVKIRVDENLAMDHKALEEAIIEDVEAGYTPLAVVAAIGTTGTTAVDPINEIGEICRKHDLWFHVDAAYAGTALILPEYRWMIKGIENADSFVFNPHKWMFTHFDCTAYFVRDPNALVKTFEILPEYLKTFSRGKVKDYRDWGIPMGRRFRALKLWFVIRNFGVGGLRERIRKHIDIAADLESWVKTDNRFELMSERLFNLVCFRFRPAGIYGEDELEAINERLEKKINDSGHLFLTHTKVGGKYSLRMVVAQTEVSKEHVKKAWDLIVQISKDL